MGLFLLYGIIFILWDYFIFTSTYPRLCLSKHPVYINNVNQSTLKKLLYCGQKSNYINKDNIINIFAHFKQRYGNVTCFLRTKDYVTRCKFLSLSTSTAYIVCNLCKRKFTRRNNAVQHRGGEACKHRFTRQLWMVPFACTCARIDKRLNNFAPF